MWNIIKMTLLTLVVVPCWADPTTLKELEKLSVSEIHQSIEPMIKVCEEKIDNDRFSNEEQSKARKLKRLLGHLPPVNPNPSQCKASIRAFMVDYALPGEDYFADYLSEQQKSYWRIFLRICPKHRK